jgi:hypothetical protein
VQQLRPHHTIALVRILICAPLSRSLATHACGIPILPRLHVRASLLSGKQVAVWCVYMSTTNPVATPGLLWCPKTYNIFIASPPVPPNDAKYVVYRYYASPGGRTLHNTENAGEDPLSTGLPF